MSIAYLNRDGLPRLAYRLTPASGGAGALPAVLFCGGFRSDMEGTKAQYLEARCAARGQAFTRFDYSGHGASGGRFEDGSISIWLQDTFSIIDEVVPPGPLIVIGSSMGGWIGLLAARARPVQVRALIGIAAAPDFTRDIYEQEFSAAQRAALAQDGFVRVPNAYSEEPYIFTRALIEDGAAHCLLDGRIDIEIPVCLLQGMRDTAVPWQKAHRIKNALAHPELAEVILIESGDHSLSRPEDLDLLDRKLDEMTSRLGSA